MSTWSCKQCTFSNHLEIKSCEMCYWSPPVSCAVEVVTLDSNATQIGDRSAHITCTRCSYHNDLSAENCVMCGEAFSERHESGSRVVTCSRCHISFPADMSKSSIGSHLRKPEKCPNCGDGLRENLDFRNKPSGQDDKEFQCELITFGIIELIEENLAKTDSSVNSCAPTRKITTEYALCSPCPHVSQNGTAGFDWSCGYRNIQMICHSLLLQSDAENDFKGLLFNGQGDSVNGSDLVNYAN